MKKRLLAMIMVVVMAVSLLPMNAFAAVELAVSIKDDIATSGKLAANVTDAEGEVSYQWYKNNDAIEGATSETLYVATANSANDTLPTYSVTATDSDGNTGTAQYTLTYYTALQNGSFEKPTVTSSGPSQVGTFGGLINQFPNGTTELIWKTTASDGRIELVHPLSNGNNSNFPTRGHDGSQFAELNAQQFGALYQDIMTEPGSTLYYSFIHSGRGNATNTMQLVIGATDSYDANWNPADQDLSEEEGFQGEYKTPGNKWMYYEGSYKVPEGQYITRFYFCASSSTGSADGNLLDRITFSATKPTPPADTAVIGIEKTVDKTMANPGDTLTYTITLKNTGNAAGTETVVDTLPTGLTNPTNITNGGVLADGVITWADVTVATGGTVTLSFDVKIPANAVADTTYKNVATIDGTNKTDDVTTTVAEVEKHNVTYAWTNEPTDGYTQDLPNDITNLVKGETYTVDTKYIKGYVVNSKDAFGNVNGKWTFSGWNDPNNGTMGESDVTVTGSWTYEDVEVKEYQVKVIYHMNDTSGITFEDPTNQSNPFAVVNGASWAVSVPVRDLQTDKYKYAEGTYNYTAPQTVKLGNVNFVYDYVATENRNNILSRDAANSDTTINLVYSMDLNNDDIPDQYQVTLEYKADPTEGGFVTNAGKNVITLKDENGKWTDSGAVTVGSTAAAGEDTEDNYKYEFVNWTHKNNELTESESLKVENFKVAGGQTYTFVAHFSKKYVYQIEYYTEKLDVSGTYELKETTMPAGYGAKDELVSVTPDEDKYASEGYAYDPYVEGTLTSGKVTEITKGEDGKPQGILTLKLYYSVDTKGDITDPENKGDGTPDKYQKKVTFKVVNGAWNDKKTDDVIKYVTLKTDNVWNENGTYTVTKEDEENIPAAGSEPNSGYKTGSWDALYKAGDIIKDKDDPTYTYTYAKKSNNNNGGGGSSKPPVLNKEDHYAYIVGYPDGTVQPGGNITRAEVATIFFRMLTDDSRNEFWSQTNSYSDVSEGQWFNNAISTLANAGILSGYPDGTFRPNAPITRAEFTKIAASFFERVEYTIDNPFNDVDDDDWFYKFVMAAYEGGLITGYPEGDFRPNANISRAESVTIVNRTLERAPDADHFLKDMIVWPDNAENAWYYEAVQEATNSHEYVVKGTGTNKYEEWTKILEVRDWPALEKEWSNANSATGGEVVK